MLDLKKAQERKNLALDLVKKSGFTDDISAQVVLALDFSGSMDHLYANDTVQDTVERILPLGLAFDIDRQVDFFLFHHGYIALPETLTTKNTDGYINSKVMNNYQMGGTNYAPIINAIVEKYGVYDEQSTTVKKGWFGMGSTTEVARIPKKMETPVYVIMITDGENSDQSEAEAAIREAAKHAIFFKFVGIGSATFSFLQKLDDLKGRHVDNADFFKVPNLKTTSDDQLYKLLLTEFTEWLKLTKSKGMY